MGLPGSGKTTLANELATLLDAKRLNADEVRKEANDWGFFRRRKKKTIQKNGRICFKIKERRKQRYC